MFFDLPVELQRHCLASLDIEALRSFRLVSTAALALATENLFSTVNLLPSDESAVKYTQILEEAKLSRLVRTVVFNTSEDPNATGWNGDASNEESDLLESFIDAMRNISRFPNVREVELKFARECAVQEPGGYGWDKEVAETHSFRTEVLAACFEGLNSAEHPAIDVDSLTIKNLQDATSEEFYESDNFRGVIGRLRKLHLQIATECDDAAPENSIEKPGCHQMFNQDLQDHWLKPLQSQLTHLTIYATECFWGFWPNCDLLEVHFPKLKSLSLGNWTIVHERQIDWILSHGETLEELLLDDCPIISTLKMEETQAKTHWPDLDPKHHSRHSKIFMKEVAVRWQGVFARFQSGLPHLRHFALGHGNWDEQTMFEERYEILPRLLPSRYHMFDCGIGPSQWVEGDDCGLTENAQGLYTRKYQFSMGQEVEEEHEFPACDDEDLDALNSLLAAVGKTALVNM